MAAPPRSVRASFVIRAKPNAKVSAALAEEPTEQGTAFVIAVAAPPRDGAANEALTAFLAEVLGTARSKVTIGRGASGRHKRIDVEGLDEAAVLAALRAALPREKSE